MADVIPNALEDVGTEIGKIWPIFVLVGAIIGVGWRGITLMQKTVKETMEPLNLRVSGIESELRPNGGSSLRDRLDQIGFEVSSVAASQAESEAVTKVFFEASPQAMYRSDEHGITVQCNQAYLDFWGFTDISQARSNDWLSYMSDRALADERLASIVRTPAKFVYDADLLDGRRLRVVGRPIHVTGEFCGYIGYVFDLNNQRKEVL